MASRFLIDMRLLECALVALVFYVSSYSWRGNRNSQLFAPSEVLRRSNENYNQGLLRSSSSDEIKKRSAVDALNALQSIDGEYDVSYTEFGNVQTTTDDITLEGFIRCKFIAEGYAFTIEKSNLRSDGTRYDDLMIFRYSQEADQVQALLFSPGVGKLPRIDVEIKSSDLIVLDYYESVGNSPVFKPFLRETISVTPPGLVTWLVEGIAADGAYFKIRELIGKRR